VLAATPAVSATDHRLGWSRAPAVVVVLGDLLIVLAHIGFCLVFRANTYGVATIQVPKARTSSPPVPTPSSAALCMPGAFRWSWGQHWPWAHGGGRLWCCP